MHPKQSGRPSSLPAGRRKKKHMRAALSAREALCDRSQVFHVDFNEVICASKPLNHFTNLADLVQWLHHSGQYANGRAGCRASSWYNIIAAVSFN
jgi:hypothetical protein